MTIKYGQVTSTIKTPQSERIPGRVDQVANNAGGFVFAVDDWKRLERFLILGSEGGTYYAGERKLTLENAAAVRRCIDVDGIRVVNTIVEVSQAARAPKNDPALFALAMCCRFGSREVKEHAYHVGLPAVARIGTHLFHWADNMKHLGGLGGNGAHRAIARWYNDKPAADVAHQIIKYQQRDGWSHRDLLRLAHPKGGSDEHKAIFNYAVKGWPEVGATPHDNSALRQIWAFERAKTARGEDLLKLIYDYRLPHECVPNEAKGDVRVWEAMSNSMGLTALLRNLGKMTSVGLLAQIGGITSKTCERLTDVDQLTRARIHPLQVLVALNTYRQGHGDKGKLTWQPVQRLVDALDAAFYACFKAVVPTGKRTLLALDCSGSMGAPVLAGMSGVTPKIGAAAMALVTAASEPEHMFVGFTAGNMAGSNYGGCGLQHLEISPRQRLDDVVRTMERVPFGGTNCALPMLWAAKEKVGIDTFVVYTDSETWAGDIHANQALKLYRQRTGIPAKCVVVGMTSTGFTIADPTDAGMLDVTGFDTAAPAVIADFARG